MVTNTIIRNRMRLSVKRADPTGNDIKWEMSRFRHAIFKTAAKCPMLQDVRFSFDKNKELSTCMFVFKSKLVKAVYNYKDGSVALSDEKKSSNCTYEEMDTTMKSFQPPVMVVRKKVVVKK